MVLLDPTADPNAFFTRLAQDCECALLIDYDGILTPHYIIERERAFPDTNLLEGLHQIARLGNTRLVIVSGHAVREVCVSLGFEGLGFERHRPEIWGCHGWERLLPDGTYCKMGLDEQVREGLALAYRSIIALACESPQRRFAMDGHIERTPVGLALNWRGCAPAAIAEFHDSLIREWMTLARENGLKLCDCKEGVELRASGRTKIDAVETVMRELEEGAAVAYLGDGASDEDAFRALKGKVLTARVHADGRASAADLWVESLHELRDVLWLWKESRRHALAVALR